MKWIGLLAVSSAVYASTVAAQAHIRCQNTIGGPCGDSSRPREYNCCDYGYCQPWNSGYYQCLNKPDKCPTQETDIDYAGNDIKTIRGILPDKCCEECSNTPGCTVYTFVNQNPDGKSACYLKKSAAGRVEKKGAVSGQLSITTPPPPATCPEQEWNVDYYGNDLKTLNGITQTACCDECSKLVGCAAYTFVEKNPDGKSACYLKSSTAGKVAKAGAVSGKVKNPATTAPPTTPPPPPNCPVQENDVDYYGNDLKTLNGVSQYDCCEACGKTDTCVAYSFVAKSWDGKSACYLKSSTAGKVAKAGVVSGQRKTTPPPTTPPPPTNCPVQEINTDYYGNDIKNIIGGTQTECCDACGKTDKCVAYSFVAKGADGKSACYLKSSTAGKVAKAGVVSGKLKDPVTTPPPTTPPPPTNCPVQEIDVDYYGNDLKTLYALTQGGCCDECTKFPSCVAYTFVAKGPDGRTACYLKSSKSGKVAKVGAISGTPSYVKPPANCPSPMMDTEYLGYDIKSVGGVTYGECCDACGATSGCVAAVYRNGEGGYPSSCQLKWLAYRYRTMPGAIAMVYVCPTPVYGSCGSAASGPLCCPPDSYCQPWNSKYYQCMPQPDSSKCNGMLTNVDFYGGDIEVKYGLQPAQCCDACFNHKDCTVFTFVNENPDGKTACYLKNKFVEQRAKVGAVSAYKVIKT